MRNLVISDVYGTEEHIQSLIDGVQPRLRTNNDGEYELLMIVKTSPNCTAERTLMLRHSGSLNVNNGLQDWKMKDNYGNALIRNKPFHMTVKGAELWEKYLKGLEALFIDWIKSN